MAILIEKKTYANKELAPLIGVNPESAKLKRDITNQLTAMGFEDGEDFSFPKRGYITILWIPQTPEERIPYLCKLMGIDTRVDAFNFATFVYCLLEEEDFQYRPWEEKSVWLKDCCGIEVSERTLRSWTSKLMKTDTLIKDTDSYTWWTTTTIDGTKIREELDDDDQSIEAYRDFNKEFFNREDVKKMDKKTRGSCWFSEMWSTFGCKFYKCYRYTFGAWHNELLQDLIDTTKEWMNQE